MFRLEEEIFPEYGVLIITHDLPTLDKTACIVTVPAIFYEIKHLLSEELQGLVVSETRTLDASFLLGFIMYLFVNILLFKSIMH